MTILGDGMIRIFLVITILLFTLTSPAQIPSQFIVGSYNLFGLKNPKEIKNDLKKLDFVQVWAFQEMEGSFNEKTAENLLKILPEGQWYLHLEKVNRLRNNTWEGQVIASRFPIESIEVLKLNHSAKKERVAVIAHFKTADGRDFSFTNTDHEVDIFKIDFSDRKKQLLSLVERFKNSNGSAIITGDFNTTGGTQEINSTEKIMLQAGFERAKCEDNSPTFEKFFIQKELDHFFSRNLESSKRYRYGERKGSDHYPIYIEVRL